MNPHQCVDDNDDCPGPAATNDPGKPLPCFACYSAACEHGY